MGEPVPPSPTLREPHTLRLYTILLYFPFVQNHFFSPLYFTKLPPALGEGRGKRGDPAAGSARPLAPHLTSAVGWVAKGGGGTPGVGLARVVVWHQIPPPLVHPACSSQPWPPSCNGYCHGGIINRLSE